MMQTRTRNWLRKPNLISAVTLMASIILVFTSCTQSIPTTRADGKVFTSSEVITQADRIEVYRFDPERGRTWQSSFRRELAHGSAENREAERWVIEHAPDGAKVADSLGDTAYFTKLIDLLKTLQIRKTAGSAPLSELGLEPAQVNLRFHRQGGNSVELKLGTVSDGAQFAYATLSSEPNQPVWEVQGAALQFLAFMDSFESLRERRLLSPLEADDVDIVRLSRGTQTILKAERNGTHWAANAKKLSRDGAVQFTESVQSRLEDLLHLRIKTFIDEPSSSQALTQALKPNSETRPTYLAEFTDRQDRVAKLEIYREKTGKLYAMTSLRPQVWFEIHPEAERPWKESQTTPAELPHPRGTP